VLPTGQTVGLTAVVEVSNAPNGSFFTTGDKPVLTIKLNSLLCNQTFKPADLGTAELLLSGPRRTLQTTTAVKLLNALTVPNAQDPRQHHLINLKAPQFADASQNNLTVGSDGTITYRLAAVSVELPGTYTAGVWAVSNDGIDQVLQTKDFQIGTPTIETYASGNPPNTTCYNCHLGTKSGKSYQAHILPGFAPFGNYALDQTPISNCQLCHNNNSLSPNPIVRKVHGAHRGENQKAPGVKHPDYATPLLPNGLGPDATLAEYTNIAFPPLLRHDKDCVACHTDDRWMTAPSRIACGTCHDNVKFDSGTLVPPRDFGTPTPTSICHSDLDCAAFGSYWVTCDTSGGSTNGHCLRTTHAQQSDDSGCFYCHAPGISPIALKHEVPERTRVRKLKITEYSISGGSGPNGEFHINETPTIKFKLTCDHSFAPMTCPTGIVADLKTNSTLSGNLVVAGPSDDRQRIYGPTGTVNIKTTGNLTYDMVTSFYTYVFPNPIPPQAFTPLNNPTLPQRDNVSGSYTVYLYVTESFSGPPSFSDYASVVKDFNLVVNNVTLPVRPRQVITNAACNSCHLETVAHGSSRRDPEACGVCHTANAQDRIAGGLGNTCSASMPCPNPSFESCVAGTCTMFTDPTPNITIRFPVLVHKIHFARLLEGYAERNDTVFPGKLAYVGFRNTVINLSEILFPQDVGNCTKCHADAVTTPTGAACSASQLCGIGQECQSGKCVNRAWVKPSAEVCISCHDAADTFGHVQIFTYQSPDGPIETCEVCHGERADFAVEKVHNIWNPYVPPYPRTKE
jgi:hypothetical protein